MFTEGKWPRPNRRLAKLVAKLFRSSFADDIAAMVVGHTTEERRVRIFQGDTHRVVVQGFNFIDDRKVRCKAGALRIGCALDRVHHVRRFQFAVAAVKLHTLAQSKSPNFVVG
ncbi:hypothetical protein D3C84_950420 [compost metagenome]